MNQPQSITQLAIWRRLIWPVTTAVAFAALAVPVISFACPFCTAVARTFSEQMGEFDIVVVASLETTPESEDETRLPRATFRIVDFLKGRETFETELPLDKTFEAIVVSRQHEIGDHFLVMGNGTRQINWSTPMKVSDRVVEYLKQLDSLPEKGPIGWHFSPTISRTRKSCWPTTPTTSSRLPRTRISEKCPVVWTRKS